MGICAFHRKWYALGTSECVVCGLYRRNDSLYRRLTDLEDKITEIHQELFPEVSCEDVNLMLDNILHDHRTWEKHSLVQLVKECDRLRTALEAANDPNHP